MRWILPLLMLTAAAAGATDLDPTVVARFAYLALDCVHQEYPNKIAHVLQSDDDVAPPRELAPAFHGCFDWHSAVHGHWLLTRLARLYPDADFTAEARTALARSLTATNIAAEVAYFEGEDRASYERPYGLAWLLQLGAELREWSADAPDDAEVKAWSNALAPLESVAADRLRNWLPKLHYAIRTGEHSQSAFALGLVLDWARTAGDSALASLVEDTAIRHYAGDVHCPLGYEPSGQDFLSPCLAEADVMRRILPPDRYVSWLRALLPQLARAGAGEDWLPVAVVTDRVDGKLAHLDGLNLSRAWMLEGIAAAVGPTTEMGRTLLTAAARHRDAGLAAITGEHYAGGHWLGSFATYLVTRRGLSNDQAAAVAAASSD